MDPFLHVRKRFGVDAACANPANLLCAYEPARLQHLEVLNHSRQRDLEGLRQIRNRGRAAAEPLHYRQARGIAKGMEDAVDLRSLAGHARTNGLMTQFFCQCFQQFPPSRLAHLRAVAAFEESCLFRENQVRPVL